MDDLTVPANLLSSSSSLSPLSSVAAVVAAAGFSRRMGRFKPLLPWGNGTVIESVVAALTSGGAAPALVVTGHRGVDIADRLVAGPASIVPNPDYARNEMLRSYQVGIQALLSGQIPVIGALLALGDQPHIPASVIRQIVDAAQAAPKAVVIPSHNRRRGHPVYLPRRLFSQLLTMADGQSLRDLLDRCHEEIVYVALDTDSIRRDLDVPAEYDALRAEFEKTG
jgi:molybdenum cofactor cytidylyltransferase